MDLKKAVEKADKETVTRLSEGEQVDEILGDSKNEVTASSTGKKYKLFPVSLKKIPELTGKIRKIVDIMQNSGSKDDSEIFAANGGEIITVMSEIISMGLKDELTPEQVSEEFSLGDFPKCFEKALDMNDFFTGMRNIFQRKVTNA